MRTRVVGRLVAAVVGLGSGAIPTAAADPAPRKLDPAPLLARARVFQDAVGGTYVVVPRAGDDEARLFYGTGRALHAQVIVGQSRDGDGWSLATWSPRIPGLVPGEVRQRPNGEVVRDCGPAGSLALTERTGAAREEVLGRVELWSEAQVRRPRALGRDDEGTYYYVDALARAYGGRGFRVFAGKRGAMRQLPLRDVADDDGGMVLATRAGTVRLLVDGAVPTEMAWIKGTRRVALRVLDPELNLPLIFRELGVYGFTGNLCEDL